MLPQKKNLILLICIIYLSTLDNFSQALKGFNFTSPKFSVELNKQLKEISGLTLDNKQRLFAHNDEFGIIYELNPTTGAILKEFQIGQKKMKDDFEDIAFVNNIFYLLNSKGDLFYFKEGSHKGNVKYNRIETGLKVKYDTEGLCYDEANHALLIASKESTKKSSSKYVFRFDLKKMKLDAEPFISIDLTKITKGKKKEEFKPSAIAKNVEGNSYFILGGKKLCIIEIKTNGEIIAQVELSDKFHNQPEGMVILNNEELLISDEANKKNGKLTSYKLIKKADE